jgi:hypothetical protein
VTRPPRLHAEAQTPAMNGRRGQLRVQRQPCGHDRAASASGAGGPRGAARRRLAAASLAPGFVRGEAPGGRVDVPDRDYRPRSERSVLPRQGERAVRHRAAAAPFRQRAMRLQTRRGLAAELAPSRQLGWPTSQPPDWLAAATPAEQSRLAPDPYPPRMLEPLAALVVNRCTIPCVVAPNGTSHPPVAEGHAIRPMKNESVGSRNCYRPFVI